MNLFCILYSASILHATIAACYMLHVCFTVFKSKWISSIHCYRYILPILIILRALKNMLPDTHFISVYKMNLQLSPILQQD